MSGSKAGGVKLRQTMINKFGSEEAWREWMKENGSKGGKNGTTGGVAGDSERASILGAKGGKVSKRGYKFIKEVANGREYIDKSTNTVVVFRYDGTLEKHN